MFRKKEFIYCADAGLGSLNIRNFNSMGERAFVFTQSIKKLSGRLKEAVFNDYDYRLLSSDEPVMIEALKSFDRQDPGNKDLYNDRAYKILTADTAFDLGLYEEKKLKNGKTVRVKSKAEVKHKVIITFSRKMMEYQRYIRGRQIKRAKKYLRTWIPKPTKRVPMISPVLSKEPPVQKAGRKSPTHTKLTGIS